MRAAIVSGIVVGDAPFSYWSIFRINLGFWETAHLPLP